MTATQQQQQQQQDAWTQDMTQQQDAWTQDELLQLPSPPMRFDKSLATDNIFQNSLYTQTPSAENILPFVQTSAADMTTRRRQILV